jgi:coenzyme F420 hydrogenase subunit beta
MPPSSLKILPETAPLRGGAPLSPFLTTQLNDDEKQPRALRGLARIIDGGLCHRCGSCVGLCPTGVLGVSDEGYPEVQHLSSCTDCDLCVKVCPGDEFNVQEHHKKMFGVELDHEDTHGHFLEGIVSHSTDPLIQEKSTSGGLVTALLLDLLEKGEIDGAITIQSDEATLWKGKPSIARTPESLKSAMKSKYAISPTNVVLSEIRNLPGKYAVVGLPCQIHGIVKAKELDQRIAERVVLTVALFCHAAIEHDAFKIIWESLGEHTNGAKRFVSRIGKHPGTPYLEKADGSLYPVYFGEKTGYRPTSIEMINILYRLYTPSRCLTCFDATGLFADIAVGDPWMAPPDKSVDFYKGWSFALIRNNKAAAMVKRMEDAGSLKVVHLTERETRKCNTMMSHEKLWRAFRMIETHRRQGKPIPEYRLATPKHSFKHFIKTELHMLSHTFCFLPRLRGAVLRFMLGNGGYYLLWLNEKRRAFRFWKRDTLEAIRRKIKGRA